MHFHTFRSFIVLLLIIVVLASAFTVGANAIYFTVDTIPYDQLTISTPQSYGSGVLNTGSKSYAWVQSGTVSPDAINSIFLFGVPDGTEKFKLYALFVLDNTASSSSGSFQWQNSSIIRGSGLNFSADYAGSSYNVGLTGSNNFYDQPLLFSYRIVNLFSYDKFNLSDIASSNFSFEYGNLTYNSEEGKIERTVLNSFNSATPFSSLTDEAKDLIDDLFPTHIDLTNTGSTTTLVNTTNSSGSTTPPGSTSPGGDSTGSDASDSDISTTVVTPGSGPVFNSGDLDYFNGLDGLLSDLDNASSIMESNQVEIGENFGFVQNIFASMFEQFPPVIVALIICAIIVLIAVKIIGR